MASTRSRAKRVPLLGNPAADILHDVFVLSSVKRRARGGVRRGKGSETVGEYSNKLFRSKRVSKDKLVPRPALCAAAVNTPPSPEVAQLLFFLSRVRTVCGLRHPSHSLSYSTHSSVLTLSDLPTVPVQYDPWKYRSAGSPLFPAAFLFFFLNPLNQCTRVYTPDRVRK